MSKGASGGTIDRAVWATGLTIGAVTTRGRVMLGPMAGVTDLPYRLICLEQGCGHTYTEMLADMALIYQNRRTEHMAVVEPGERPVTVQLVGNSPRTMADAARIVADFGADIVDLNMGCPAPKIVNNGEGSALMKQPELAAAIVGAVVHAVDVPVTVKFRRGWDPEHENAVEFARLLVDAGAAALAVHGRFRSQFYSGTADWDVIQRVKAAVTVPVIGNGDITGPESAARLVAATGCDAVMIGRAAQGNPWIFRQVSHYLATGETLLAPTAAERIDMAIRHLHDLVAFKGERIAVLEMRRHSAWYTRGLSQSTRARVLFNQAETEAELRQTLEAYLAYVEGRGQVPWGDGEDAEG